MMDGYKRNNWKVGSGKELQKWIKNGDGMYAQDMVILTPPENRNGSCFNVSRSGGQ